nr:ImmA/IrrE family metallo-endopeptidase [Metasolibacillus meyeri]
MLYENLMYEADQLDIRIFEKWMPYSTKGLYADNVIWINKHIPSQIEKACVLAEEMGHYHTSSGDILDLKNVVSLKQELNARRWAYKKLVPLHKIIQAHKLHIANRYELADYLNVTENFLDDALEWYTSKYGLSVSIDNFTICFEPLGVIELFEWVEKPKQQYGT